MCFIDVKEKYAKIKWQKWECIFKEEVWDEDREMEMHSWDTANLFG